MMMLIYDKLADKKTRDISYVLANFLHFFMFLFMTTIYQQFIIHLLQLEK